VQEEAFVLGKRIVTLRRTTEWIETVVLGYNQLVGLDDVGEAVKGVVAAIEERPLPVLDLARSPRRWPSWETHGGNFTDFVGVQHRKVAGGRI